MGGYRRIGCHRYSVRCASDTNGTERMVMAIDILLLATAIIAVAIAVLILMVVVAGVKLLWEELFQ